MPFLGGRRPLQKMKIKYKLSTNIEGETEQKEEKIEGFFWGGDEESMIRYVEEDGSQTNWILKQDLAVLLRKGEMPYKQTFSLEKAEGFQLHTTAGKMDLTTVTEQYHLLENKEGIEVELKYTLYTGNLPLAHYHLTLSGKFF